MGAADDLDEHGRVAQPVKTNFPVIVVGAGLAGLAAAYTLARSGVEVLVLERGDVPGAKNLMGGVLYRRPTEEVFPGFAQGAPVERRVTRQSFWLMTGDSAITAGYHGGEWMDEPNAFTVLRARFDPWLAARAEKAGVRIINETTVTELIVEGGRVAGVRTSRPRGDLYADVVIIAQGVNRLLLEQAGLAPPLEPREVAVAVKEVIALPRETIESRFNLEPGEGATIEMLGQATRGVVGAGFLYTNLDSVSIGVGVLIHQLVETKLNPNTLLEGIKSHPMVRRLIAGGETKEYTAHMIPEGGYRSVPQVYGDGFLVAGDAAMLCNGIHREGSNLAMISGKLAAETVLEARAEGDFSARTLSRYRARLEESFILKDLKKYENTNEFFDHHPEFFRLYPALLNRAAHEMLTVDGVPKKEKQALVWKMVRRSRAPWRVARDLYLAWRTLG